MYFIYLLKRQRIWYYPSPDLQYGTSHPKENMAGFSSLNEPIRI